MKMKNHTVSGGVRFLLVRVYTTKHCGNGEAGLWATTHGYGGCPGTK